jgi:L-rhamnonate dehydratase
MRIKGVRAQAVDLRRARERKPVDRREKASSSKPKRPPPQPAARHPAPWLGAMCVVDTDDGTFGCGMTTASGPVCSIINDHLADIVVGESAMATEKIYDLLIRATASYANSGVASHAIAAVDLALWDLKGKLLGRPVYELLGGPQKDHIPCYATGVDVEWYRDLGFSAVKLPLPFDPTDGVRGIAEAERKFAEVREQVGPGIDLMLDCWLALDVEYTVRLGTALRPYNLRWIEDYLLPEETAGFRAVRQRLPGQGLATGEHWYTTQRFAEAISERWVDVLQPDVTWMGLTPCVHVCHMAAAAGLAFAPHYGMNTPYGQHLVFALPAATLGELGISGKVPLAERDQLPGTAVVEDGKLVPSAEPGFGLEVDRSWLEKVAV